MNRYMYKLIAIPQVYPHTNTNDTYLIRHLISYVVHSVKNKHFETFFIFFTSQNNSSSIAFEMRKINNDLDRPLI